MAEIAQSLGVAPSTVSRALRSDPRISAATRQRVQEAAEKLKTLADSFKKSRLPKVVQKEVYGIFRKRHAYLVSDDSWYARQRKNFVKPLNLAQTTHQINMVPGAA